MKNNGQIEVDIIYGSSSLGASHKEVKLQLARSVALA